MLKRIGLLLFLLHAGCSGAPAERYDVLIRNGEVIDGTGAAAKRVDVGLRDGKIAFVGDAGDAQAEHTIDARGLTVAPGFVDPHNHVPDSLGQSPAPFLNATFLTQGVTTIVGGADGFFSPSQIRGYSDQLARGGIGTNYAYYIGHNGIRTEVMGNAIKAIGYTGMRIVDAPDAPELVGQKIHALAEARGQDPYTFVAELILAHDHPIVITLGSIKEADVRELLVQPWNMICSDGVYADHGTTDSRHPRNTGTFTRVLGYYVRETGVLTLPEAIRKLTSLPADFLRLTDRGRIAVGQVADVVVFDAQRVRARSTYTDPDVFSEGIIHVLVNGTFAMRDGAVTGATPGRFVKRQTAVQESSAIAAQ
ncbi:MAG: amidohydrolase family protein [Burkholderiaceae bacterium]